MYIILFVLNYCRCGFLFLLSLFFFNILFLFFLCDLFLNLVAISFYYHGQQLRYSTAHVLSLKRISSCLCAKCEHKQNSWKWNYEQIIIIKCATLDYYLNSLYAINLDRYCDLVVGCLFYHYDFNATNDSYFQYIASSYRCDLSEFQFNFSLI